MTRYARQINNCRSQVNKVNNYRDCGHALVLRQQSWPHTHTDHTQCYPASQPATVMQCSSSSSSMFLSITYHLSVSNTTELTSLHVNQHIYLNPRTSLKWPILFRCQSDLHTRKPADQTRANCRQHTMYRGQLPWSATSQRFALLCKTWSCRTLCANLLDNCWRC